MAAKPHKRPLGHFLIDGKQITAAQEKRLYWAYSARDKTTRQTDDDIIIGAIGHQLNQNSIFPYA